MNRSDGLTCPIFIVGSGRSGTTLLRRLLIERSDIYIPPETYVLGTVIEQSALLRRLPWPDFVFYVVSRFEYDPEFHRFGVDSMRSFVHERVRAPVEEQNLESLLDALYLFFSREAGQSCIRWGDKTPYNTYFLPQIARTFPRATFIAMLRDGCDVVASYVKAGLYPDHLSAARRWVDSNQLVYAFHKRNPSRIMTLRYENLITAPDRHLTEVMDFAGLPLRSANEVENLSSAMRDAVEIPHLNNALAPVNPSNSGKGRMVLSNEADDDLRKLMNPALRRLGYPEI